MAGSGMATGGRVRHHLKHNLWRPDAGIIFVGFAAQGTLARIIIDGAKSVRIFGEEIPVKAKVHTIGGFSAHADQQELLAWHRSARAARTYLVHGDEKVMKTFAPMLAGHRGGDAGDEPGIRAVGVAMDDDDDLGDLTHAAPAYKRALWIVTILNVGYGLIEAGGGFLAGSQGLKADALDFLGDGTITLLGLIAIGWGPVWRARSALAQGIFLAVMGLGVLAATLYRVFVAHVPQAELMGAFGIVALVVNVICAVILLKHREGDANVQAVWLFSRNDALGNAAIVVAAVLVAATGTPWPDLVVAAAIAALFLQSAWRIIVAARRELAEVG